MFRNSFGYYKTLSVHHFEAGCLKEKQQNTIYLPGQCFVSVRPTMAATSHLRLLSTWNGAIVIAELNYLIYFKCKSYTCYSWHGFWLNEKREPHLFFPLEYGKSQLSMSKSLIFSVVRISPTAGASMASQSCSPTRLPSEVTSLSPQHSARQHLSSEFCWLCVITHWWFY